MSERELSPVERTVEALLFLSPDPVSIADLAAASECAAEDVSVALDALRERYERAGHGLVLREVGGGYTLATHPDSAAAARRLLARPRIPQLTPAQAETLAIVAYLQPISRPEIARIRGVNVDTATATLLERGLIEQSGRSRFGAILYRTTALFLKVFGLEAASELPDISQWDATPEEAGELRERLLAAGEARNPVPSESRDESQEVTLS